MNKNEMGSFYVSTLEENKKLRAENKKLQTENEELKIRVVTLEDLLRAAEEQMKSEMECAECKIDDGK